MLPNPVPQHNQIETAEDEIVHALLAALRIERDGQ